MADTPTVTDRDVLMSRAFDAPRAVVWTFWTAPQHLSSWFGPDGFHTPVETVEIDLEVGGRWNLTMVDDEGNGFPIRGRITALRPEEYLEVTLDADAGSGPIENVVLRVTFHDHGDRTRISLHQGPLTDEQRTQTLEGWEMSFVTLDSLLAEVDS